MWIEKKPLCDTTMTPRNPAHLCCCVKRTDEMGPCDIFEVGMGGRCVFCDHEGACHGPAPPQHDLAQKKGGGK